MAVDAADVARLAAAGRDCPELPAAYAARLAAAAPPRADDADAGPPLDDGKVAINIGTVVDANSVRLRVDGPGPALPTIIARLNVADAPLDAVARVAARPYLVTILADIAARLRSDDDASARLAALRRLDRLAVGDARAIASSGVGRAAADVRKGTDAVAAALAKRVVSGMKRRVAAAPPTPAPTDAATRLEAVLPRGVAIGVAEAIRARGGGPSLLRGLLADLRRNSALRQRVASGSLTPEALVALDADARQTDDARRKRARVEAPAALEDEVAEGYACESCGTKRVSVASVALPMTSYGTSEVRDVLFLRCLDCGHSWRDGDD